MQEQITVSEELKTLNKCEKSHLHVSLFCWFVGLFVFCCFYAVEFMYLARSKSYVIHQFRIFFKFT